MKVTDNTCTHLAKLPNVQWMASTWGCVLGLGLGSIFVELEGAVAPTDPIGEPLTLQFSIGRAQNVAFCFSCAWYLVVLYYSYAHLRCTVLGAQLYDKYW